MGGISAGGKELLQAMGPERGAALSVGLFSVFVNVLMLTGPLFMLQVYDRVLGSRSEETLVALLVLVGGLYGLMGLLDYARGRISARIGAAFQVRLDRRVFGGTLEQSVRGGGTSALRDLEAIQRVLSSQALFALVDIPWTPIFILMIFVFHPLLGWLALSGGAVLVGIAIINQLLTNRPVSDATVLTAKGDSLADNLRAQSEVVRGLGMQDAALDLWQSIRTAGLTAQILSSDLTGSFSTLSKTLRLFLQSLILALGAFLVLQGEITAGAMIATSILLGRALSPVEQAIAHWPLILRAKHGWRSLKVFLTDTPKPDARTDLTRPRAFLNVQNLSVVPPGSQLPTLRIDGFSLEPGVALGVIGASASGKSTLARALTNIWQPVTGSIRLDGATLAQYGQTLGQHVGYLPQEVTLFHASVAQNIARLNQTPEAAAVIRAAKNAGAHEMILQLPEGYDTVISGGAGCLSGGQKQRIGLARAMFGDPVLLVLDEPNASLDASGIKALNGAIKRIKSKGGSVIIMAHRPSGIAECDVLMVLQDGLRKAFGPRDEVLQSQVQNHAEVAGALMAEVGS